MLPIDICRLSAVAALSAVSVVSAFQSPPPALMTHDVSSHPSTSSVALLMSYQHQPYPPPFDPYYNPYFFQHHMPYPPRYPHPPRYPYPPRYPPPRRPRRYSVVLDAEVIDEADEILDEMLEEEEWMTDRQRAQQRKEKGGQQGDVINQFDSERTMKNAAAAASYPNDSDFQGRKPGQAVNSRAVNSKDKDGDAGVDPREQHVILDDYEDYQNDFFQPPVPPQGRPPQQRPGPSVYTQEEEDLIASMGGHGRPTTQEFAGLGQSSKKSGSQASGQQQNYNPEEGRMPPPMPNMPPPGMEQGFREEGYLGDSTLKEISLDYAIPIPYLADVLATWGIPVPIDPSARLGDMVTGEQAYAVLEAIHTLDIAALHERYSEDNLMNICDYYDIDIKNAFEFCMSRGWALPFGVRTFLRVEQEEEMLDALGGDNMY